ncbi:MAG: HDOD domain-containing protein [Burkholderiaceae bacterium]|nr:HDOD domain-containing protein [Rhodoferax sp.]MCB2031453.1 HDOD domain-containing protein [Rhodoferax sp.]MCP5261558.1 HDOD domain-containing protein [Rhodoferax sp.]MCW5628565.1 HDOD domain-containing protein [Rhodoferax sp.]MCW5642119.1 HDOD domain-containing protein [Rhodoferax sp.]
MTPELTQKLTAAVDRMPAFPRSVQQILELTRDVNCSPKDLVRVIDHDPVVMVKILRVVNSAYYSLPKQITSINHAVVYMGFNSLKNLALSIAAIGMLPKEGVPGFDAHQYLLHSLTTANIAKMLAPRVGNVDANDCFIAGLLHDFGKVVFAQFMPQEFKQALMMADWGEVSLYQTLREVIGTDHAVVGGMLVEKWRFPAPLVETIRHQHVDDLLDTEMIACVFTANQISKKLGFGAAGNPCVEALPPFIAQRVGGDLDEVIASLGDLDRMYEEAMVFANA